MVLDSKNSDTIVSRFAKTEASRIIQFGDISSVSKTRILDPIDSIEDIEHPLVSDLVEVILHWSHENFGIDEFIEAKKQFFDSFGRVFPDEDFYNQRISYFLDFFTFQRKIKKGQTSEEETPFEQFIKSKFVNKIKKDQLVESFKQLDDYRHSLFYVSKVSSNKLTLKDLFTKEKIEIGQHYHLFFEGFVPKSIIQGFIFNTKTIPYISQGVLTHPPNVTRIIRKIIKKLKPGESSQEYSLFTKLAKINLDIYKMRTQDSKKLYSQLFSAQF